MPELLQVAGLNAWYGESHVLHGMEFAVGEGELVTLLGRNGAAPDFETAMATLKALAEPLKKTGQA